MENDLNSFPGGKQRFKELRQFPPLSEAHIKITDPGPQYLYLLKSDEFQGREHEVSRWNGWGSIELVGAAIVVVL
jgi:hypothetical protein